MKFISASDLCEPDWQFLGPYCTDPNVEWTTHSGQPRNAFERLMKRATIGRYRAAWTSTREARSTQNAVLVSHLPLMAAATNVARRQRCPETPHIGFSFNFTDLPTRARRRYLANALSDITECVVYSKFERDLYPAHFDLDPKLFRFLPWAMDPPEPDDVNVTGLSAPYLCSIGGEGRDYALLADVMRKLPHLTMVVVARPSSIAAVQFSDNVMVFTDLPLAQTWRIAKDSLGLVLPLLSPDTACGNITIVGAQQLGIALVVTRSQGVSDYVAEGETARLVTARDSDALRQAVIELHDEPTQAQARVAAGLAKARSENNPLRLLEYFLEHARKGGCN